MLWQPSDESPIQGTPASSNVALSATFPMALSNTCWPNRWLFQSSRLTRVPLI